MDTIKPKKTLAEETYDILVEAICNGELKPGERLTQDDIAERLKVSRQPVNNAISILKTNGLVEESGRRGVVVSELDPALFAAIYEYRSAIEPFVVRLSIRRIDGTARSEAEETLRLGDTALKSGEVGQLVSADMAFHRMLYRWSRNEVISTSMQMNWHHIRRAMARVLIRPGSAEKSWDEHREIIAALFDGDEEGAAAAMQRHIVTAYDRVSETLG